VGGLALADQCPLGDQRAADATGNRRWRDGVLEVELGFGERGCLTRAWAASYSCWLTALTSSSGL